MNNILVVDDEPIIVQGLYNVLMDNSGLELSVWKAYSAKEAIQIMEKHRIDILITDIRMVGMSGIELTSIVRKQWSRCKIIYLTGHSDVEYLQLAVRQGAYDYLLKPVDDDKIIEVVQAVVTEVESEMETTHFIERAQLQLQHAQPVLKREFIVRLLEEQLEVPEQLKEQLDSLNIPLRADSDLLLMIGRVDRWPEEYSSKDRLLLQYAVSNIVEEYLSPFSSICSMAEGRYVVWLIQISQSSEEHDPNLDKLHWYISEMLEIIQRSIRQVLHLPFSIVLSQPYISWSILHQAYHAICELFQRGIGLDEEIIIIERTETEVSCNQKLLHSQGLKSILLHLRTLLENGEEKQFLNEMTAFFQSVQKSVFVDYTVQMELFCNLSAMFLSYINIRKIKEEMLQFVELAPLSNMNLHPNWSALTTYYIHLAKVLFKYIESEKVDQKNEIVKKIDDYIFEHLDGDLSLNNLAKQVHLSPFYLSRLYQRQKGYSLFQQITEIKIETAKRLLVEPESKVKDIALRLGFDNIPYFTKFFRKQTGVNPQKYKDSNKV